MIVIVCLDDRGGMLFNHRRQSRDQAVIDDIILTTRGSRLYMKEYTYKMFADLAPDHVLVTPDFFHMAQVGEYCLVEDMKLQTVSENIEKLIIYKWNRIYPADFSLDLDLSWEWNLSELTEFMGTSHEKINKEIYIK